MNSKIRKVSVMGFRRGFGTLTVLTAAPATPSVACKHNEAELSDSSKSWQDEVRTRRAPALIHGGIAAVDMVFWIKPWAHDRLLTARTNLNPRASI